MTDPSTSSAPRRAIAPLTRLGHIHLTVADLDGEVAFYREVLGFQVLRREEGTIWLGAGQRDLLRLVERSGASRPRRSTGLYHFAPRVPARADLAQLVRRINETGTAVQGMVDHHTHEAVYLADPEGNGMELYADRPRGRWPSWDELVRLGNAPLDVNGLLAEIREPGLPWSGLPAGTEIGHVHLHVADLAASDRFYVDILGFDKMGEFTGQAHFVSAGGYHHHLAYNIWAGRGAPPPPSGSRGLRHFTVELPSEEERRQVLERLSEAGIAFQGGPEGYLVTDPSQNGVLLTVA